MHLLGLNWAISGSPWSLAMKPEGTAPAKRPQGCSVLRQHSVNSCTPLRSSPACPCFSRELGPHAPRAAHGQLSPATMASVAGQITAPQRWHVSVSRHLVKGTLHT